MVHCKHSSHKLHSTHRLSTCAVDKKPHCICLVQTRVEPVSKQAAFYWIFFLAHPILPSNSKWDHTLSMINLWLVMFPIIFYFTDFAKVRRTISEFFRTGNSAKPKTDLAVSEVLCKGVGSSSEIGQGGMVASFDICHEDIAIGKYQQSTCTC